jgi:hypothetical protein
MVGGFGFHVQYLFQKEDPESWQASRGSNAPLSFMATAEPGMIDTSNNITGSRQHK